MQSALRSGTLDPKLERAVSMARRAMQSALRSVAVDPDLDTVYELPPLEGEIPAQWQAVPVYTLERPLRCPHCRERIRTVRVVGLTRTHGPRTSTLPCAGRVTVCPECERILSAKL